MNINDVYEEMIGRNDDGTTKSIVSVAHNFYKANEQSVDTHNDYSSDAAEVSVIQTDSLTQIKLKFDHTSFNDLRIMWNIIQNCINEIDQAPLEDEDDFHFIAVTFIPKAFNGTQFVTASNPLFVNAVASNPNDEADSICMVFNSDNVVFYETDEIDYAEIESEVDREISEEERLEMITEEKRREKEELEERRNRLVNERRNFH